MIGEKVAVSRPVREMDESKHEKVSWEREEVDDVLVAPGATADVAEGIRRDGTSVAYVLHFPKTYDKPLRGCKVEVRGEELDVVGDPRHGTPENVPTQWWYKANVGRTDG
jgi:hypothetical protein